VTPADAELYDKVVIQKLIKEVASTHQLDATTQKRFKVIIINEVDRLTLEA
jgi:replication factor C subunit 3/5